jgi:hypothetical protein
LFARTLGKDLRDFQIEERELLQYVGHLLICRLTWATSNTNTVLVLNFLADGGYKVSKNKAQVSLQEVQYLGSILSSGTWRLSALRTKSNL